MDAPSLHHHTMRRAFTQTCAHLCLLVLPCLLAAGAAQAWTLPGDKGTLDRATAQQILAAADAPQATSGFRQRSTAPATRPSRPRSSTRTVP